MENKIYTEIYTVNWQFFALNLKKFTPAKKNLHEHVRGVHGKYQVCNYSVFFNLNVLSVPGLLSLILPEYQDLSLSVVVFMTFKVLKSSSQT